MSQVYVCDDCKNTSKPAGRVFLSTGYYQREPTGEWNESLKAFDLCLDCALKRLEKAT